MSRLLWAGVGAVGAVIAAGRTRRAVRRYTPDAVGEQVVAARAGTTDALAQALVTFRAARTRRERELVEQLLVTPEGGDAGAVLRRRDRTAKADPWADDDDPAWDRADPERAGRAAARRRAPSSARPSGRVDDDEPLIDF